MRIRTGHKPDDWLECPPAHPGSMPIRGSLVVGGPGAYDQDRISKRKHLAKVKAQEEAA